MLSAKRMPGSRRTMFTSSNVTVLLPLRLCRENATSAMPTSTRLQLRPHEQGPRCTLGLAFPRGRIWTISPTSQASIGSCA